MRSHDHVLQVAEEVSREGRPVHGDKALPLMAPPLTKAASEHAHVLGYKSGISELSMHNRFDVQVHVGLSSWPLLSNRLMQTYVRQTLLLHAAVVDASEMLDAVIAASTDLSCTSSPLLGVHDM